MKLRIRNRPNFFAGLMFTALGTGFACMATRYEIGNVAQMGPGYFPLILGAVLALLGLQIATKSLTLLDEVEGIAPIDLRRGFLVLASLAVFTVLLLPLGLVLASLLLVVISALASDEFDWKYAVPTAFVLVVGAYFVFVYGLGLPIPVWPGGL